MPPSYIRQRIIPKFIVRFGNALFLAYVGGSLLFLFLLESIYNGGFSVAVKLLWIPLAVVTFGFTWWYRCDLYHLARGRVGVWVTASLTYSIVLLMSWPYVMACNAMTSSGRSIVYSGQVISKFISGARTKSHQIVITDRSSNEPITLTVSPYDFATLSVGDSIHKSFHVGGLGIPYRWRFKNPKQNVAPTDR